MDVASSPMAGVPLMVTIDGPAGSGKSTVARKLAKKLSFVHLNSGLLYRALAHEAQLRQLSLSDDRSLAALAVQLRFRFAVASDGTTRFLVGDEDLTDRLLSSEAGEKASQIAVLPQVRSELTEKQREIARKNSLVVEGRDAGTVVFPEAQFKFYLDADPSIRAQRRFAELQGRMSGKLQDKSQQPTLEDIERELKQRDDRDSTRDVSPQVKAADAMLVDTSLLTVDEVVEKLHRLIKGCD